MDWWVTKVANSDFLALIPGMYKEVGRMTTQNQDEGAITFVITDGPSREELFDALRLHNEQRRVIFQVHLKERIRSDLISHGESFSIGVNINGISAEDGSGHSWLVETCVVSADSMELGAVYGSVLEFYYQDTRRTGHLLTRSARSDGHQIGTVPARVFT